MSNRCSRCGRCCTEFATQIHFQSEEPFVTLSEQDLTSIVPILGPIYYRIKDKFMKTAEGAEKYFIPTKEQVTPYLTPREKLMLDIADHNPKECMFLKWTDDELKLPYCIIHEYHPRMCVEYPTSKGGACLHHTERKYSHDFLEYQREKIGLAVQVIRQIYASKMKYSDPVGFELLTLMMDFGKFKRNLLESFLLREFHTSKEEFDNVVGELFDLNLISLHEDEIEGISVKEVDRAVTQIMQTNGW